MSDFFEYLHYLANRAFYQQKFFLAILFIYQIIFYHSILSYGFFRDIKIIGQENIPREGPLIICSNHNNQFIDAHVIGSSVPRAISFITAAKTMRLLVQGVVARFIRCIPVERPRDIAVYGTGKIICLKDNKMIGKDTQFLKELKINSQVLTKNAMNPLKVLEIISDNECIFQSEDEVVNVEKCEEKYKICPHLDQSLVYDKVWQKLQDNWCIGIFPEGISHDGSDFMPLKPGASIMALGAMAKHKISVTIMSCGLNYYRGHRFRSKVIVVFGEKYTIPQELVQLYEKDKKQAIAQLNAKIESMMRKNIPRSKNYNDLNACLLAKILYLPNKYRCTPKEEIDLNLKFTKGFDQIKSNEKVQQLFKDLQYLSQIRTRLYIEDQLIEQFKKGLFTDIMAILWSIFMIIISLAITLPGIILNGPFGLLLRILAEKARKKESQGWPSPCIDIVGSYKIVASIVVFPMAGAIYSIAFFIVMNYVIYPDDWFKVQLWTIVFVVFWPVYAFLMLSKFDMLKKNIKAINARLKLIFKYKLMAQKEKQIQQQVRDIVNENSQAVAEFKEILDKFDEHFKKAKARDEQKNKHKKEQ